MAVKSSNTLKLLLFFLCTFILLAGCISSGPPKGAKTDIWVGKITGMAKGELRITSWPAEENSNDQIIQGQLILNVEQASGGHGAVQLKSNFSSRIKDGLMQVKISGTVEGATFMGKFIGTLSKRHGSGTWIVDVPDEAAGQYTGEWTLKKQ